jgi:hypothetical protein
MPVMSRPTMSACMISVPSKVWMTSRPAMCLTTWWPSRMPLPPGMASARRHQFADIHDTRHRRATSRPLAPASIRSAAPRRTRSRRARSAPVSPPPSGYLMIPP